MERTVTVKGLSKEFTVLLEDSLRQLKQRIKLQTGVPPFHQRLILHSERRVLKDGESLASQGVCSDSIILLVVEEKPLSILVRSHRNHSTAYEVLLKQTVAELKQKVSEQERVPADQFWLNFQGRPMDEKKQLAEYDLEPNCTVDMSLYLRGGAGDVA